MKSFFIATALTLLFSAPSLAMTQAQCAAKIDQLSDAIKPVNGGVGGQQATKVRNQLQNARSALSNNNMASCYNATSTAEGALMGK